MSVRSIAVPFFALMLFLAIVLTPDLAWASPIKQITAWFDEIIQLFLKRIIPGLCMAIIAWNGVMVGMARKNLMDCLGVFGGAAIALTASLIVGYLGTFGG